MRSCQVPNILRNKWYVKTTLYLPLFGPFPNPLFFRFFLCLIPLSRSSVLYANVQGYLAWTTCFADCPEVLVRALSIVQKDLASLNESDTCLALQAVSCMSSQVLARQLGEEVLKLLISHTSSVPVRKKAACVALSFYRMDPSFVDLAEWLDRIAPLLEHPQLGLAHCACLLAMELVRHAPSSFSLFYKHAIDALSAILLQNDVRRDYVYHRVPAPWLQVQLLALLRLYPRQPVLDADYKIKLHDILTFIWKQDVALAAKADVHEANARYSVQLEAMRLVVHLDASSPLVSRFTASLGQLLTSPETNVRYLSMEIMAHLAQRIPSLSPINLHRDVIFVALGDTDISVRRRALDLLYAMCDRTNVRQIVRRLLDYLVVAEPSLRQDLTLKISILAELHTSESSWYIDTTLELLHVAGRHVSNTTWQRILQVVTNHPKVHVYAVEQIIMYLQQALCHDSLVKLGAYLLGEYGYVVANRPGCTPMDQFQLLTRHMLSCTAMTQAMCMTTYAKWAGMYPEMQTTLLTTLQRYVHVLHMETQQRASEYAQLILLSMREKLDLQDVLDELPPFNESQLGGTNASVNGILEPNRRVSAVPVVSSVRRGEAKYTQNDASSRHRLPALTSVLPESTYTAPVATIAPVPVANTTRRSVSSVLSSPDHSSLLTSSPTVYTGDLSMDLLDLQSLHMTSPHTDVPEQPWATNTGTVDSSQALLTEQTTKTASSLPLNHSCHERHESHEQKCSRTFFPSPSHSPWHSPSQSMLPLATQQSPTRSPLRSLSESSSHPVPSPPSPTQFLSRSRSWTLPQSLSLSPPPASTSPTTSSIPVPAPAVSVALPFLPSPLTNTPASPAQRPCSLPSTTGSLHHLYIDMPFMLLFAERGTLHETKTERLTFARERPKATMRDARILCTLSITNKTKSTLLHIQDVHVHGPVQSRVITPPVESPSGSKRPTTVAPQGTKGISIEFACVKPFVDTPQVDIEWRQGDERGHSQATELSGDRPHITFTTHVVLPIALISFVTPHIMERHAFFEHWHAMRAQPELEVQYVCRISTAANSQHLSMLREAGFAILDSIDSRPENIVAAGLCCMKKTQVLVLLRWEPNQEAQLARLTVRAPDAQVARAIHTSMRRYLELL